MKPIRLSGHACQRIGARGATPQEVTETAPWRFADGGWRECRKDFSYGREWNGKVYATKLARPIFVEEANEILVVTVYVYYL